MQVALLTNGFAPYRVPLWNALADLCDLSIILLKDTSKIRTWTIELDSVSAPVISVNSRQIFVKKMDWPLSLSYWSIKRELNRLCPEVVVLCGYESPGYWAAQAWARQNGVPTVLWSESTLLSTRTKGRRIVEAIKSRFIRGCDAFYVPGETSAEYLSYFGAPDERIVVGKGVCDVEKFSRWERMGDSNVPTLLYVGQLVHRKGVLPMVEALGSIRELSWRLNIAGAGPLRDELLRTAREQGIADRIEMLGYVQQDSLSAVYRSADILLVPSLNEVWGLVVNEALLSGLYVVASDRAGASELMEVGVNGEVVSVDDEKDLAQAIRRAILMMPYDRRKIRSTVEGITIEGEAANIGRAIHIAATKVVRR